jgi:hypothetical protein
VNRYWTLTPGGSLAATYSATFNYASANVDGSAAASSFIVRRYLSATWSPVTVSGTPTVTATTISGVSGFGDFAIGEPKRNQTIDFPAPGDQTYGVAPITLTATASSELPVSYTVTAGPATVLGEVLTIAGAGSVTIQASQAGNASWNAASPVSRTITVAKKTVTPSVTVNSKTYDGTLTATITGRALSGVVGSDDVNLGASGTAAFDDKDADTGKNVTITGLSLSGAMADNYTLSSTSANTTADITKAVLTVTADNQTRAFGEADPPFTARYEGFVSGENLSNSGVGGAPSLTTTATVTSPPGDYLITAAIGTLTATNYSFTTFVEGTLTITVLGPSGSFGISKIESQGNNVELTVHTESNEWCSIIAADDSPVGNWQVLDTVPSAPANFLFTDSDVIPAVSSRYYRVVVANEGTITTNLTTYAVYVKPMVTGNWYKLSMPIDFGTSNRMDSSLGDQLAHGLGGDNNVGDLCYILDTNSHWNPCLLDSNGTWVVRDTNNELVPASITVEPWQSFWIKRRSAGSNTVSVYTGPAHDAPQTVTFRPGKWHMIAWPFLTPRREDEGPENEKGWGFAAAGAKRGGGVAVADRITVGEGANTASYYLNLDGRWCRPGQSVPASNVVFEAGKAYYYYHAGTGFVWTSKEE